MQSRSPIRLLQSFLSNDLPSVKVFTQPIDLLAKGTDAGFYRLVPQLVLQVNQEQDLVEILKKCCLWHIAVTFKAAGTSLSGQTITDAVLIELGPDFSGFSIAADGNQATFECGVRGGYANSLLTRYGRKIGPSPASISSAKIGGIVANNASGSSYGIVTNSYHTVRSMRIVTADGTLLDTGDESSRDAFRLSHGDMLNSLSAIRNQILVDASIHDKIVHKYRLKNTTGYGMNSFVDFDDPIDIFQHLMVGSEGTLGFISSVTFDTVSDYPMKACAIVFFNNLREACKAVMPLRQCQVSAAELMDRNALRSVENVAGMPSVLKSLPNDCCALLIESSAVTRALLDGQIGDILSHLQGLETLYPIAFTFDLHEYNTLWKVRKGLFTSAAATRPKGTACIIEDVAFPGEVLGDALTALNKLLATHHYTGSVMWGHLLDGNIHFLVMPDFKESTQLDNYKSFMHALTHLVVNQFDGSLKAEHGTGRNMAPFVETEWGTEIYALMKRVKQVCDPAGILNPGVLINSDPDIYYKNIKPLPVANPLIDDCIECGFCESSCPSRDFTLTPRQRIVTYREINRLKGDGRYRKAVRLQKQFDFSGNESCATDGLCAVNCPVGINTGKLIKELRTSEITPTAERMAAFVGRHFAGLVTMAHHLLNGVWYINRLIPDSIMHFFASGLHRLSGRRIPMWNRYLPKGAPALDYTSDAGATGQLKVVYFPACINRIFGISVDYQDRQSVTEKTVSLLKRANCAIIYPQSITKLCCGMAFDSKGFKQQGMLKLKELEKALLEASDNGKHPILCDMSPCLLRMQELMDKRLKLYEPVAFTLEYLKPRLRFRQVVDKVSIHSTCSNTKMGLEVRLEELASLCAREIVNPFNTGCCGWAGDKGFNLPELNKSALRYLRPELPDDVSQGFSTSRTCEIGLTLHGGISYRSILYLVDQATKED